MLINFLFTALPVIAVICAFMYLPYGIYITKKHGKQTLVFHAVKYVFFGCCFSLFYLTILYSFAFLEFPPRFYLYNLRPFVWVYEVYSMGVEKMAEQLILNIGMFIPYGALLPLAVKKTRKMWVSLLTVLGTTVSIEFVQLFMGRSCDIDDVIMNFTGGVLGYLIFMLLRKVFSEKPWWESITINAKC